MTRHGTSRKAEINWYKRQSKWNVILRRVSATTVAVKQQWVLHNLSVCICSLSYPACTAHAPCCNFWVVPIFHILLWTKRFSKKKVTENKCFDFLYSSKSKKKWARYDHKCLLGFIKSNNYPCQILMNLEFSRQILKNSPNMKVHENPSSESRVVPCGQTDRWTDRHDEANITFRYFTNAPKNNKRT